MPHPLIRTLIALTVAGAAAAQQPLTAKSFLPDDHRNVVFVDLAAMRAKGIWDELEISLLKLALQQIEQESGMALRAIDRLTMVLDPGQTTADERRDGDVKDVTVVEGNAPLGLPRWAQRAEQLEIGGHPVLSRFGALHVSPKPELYVAGHETWVRPVLEGNPHRGVPAPDVMSLLAGCEPLAYFVLDVTTPLLRANLIAPAFPATTWSDGEAPTFVCVRAVATGDPDDPHLTIEAIVRHARDGAGVAATAKAAEALRDRLLAMPELRAVKPVLAGMTTKSDRGDVICTLDLGRMRNAIGHAATFAGLLLVARTMEAQVVQEVVIQEVPADPVPVPVEPKNEPKKH